MSKNLTEVRLLAVPLENDYIHTLYFDSLSDQETYFKSKTVDYMTDCSYQRKDNFIRYNKQFDEILNCNYVMYKNPAYSDKWFYAFITKMEYKDDGRTDIYIETDVIQTWLKDYTVKPSFVEREHVIDDTIGVHTVPEGLETGDYIVNDITSYGGLVERGIILACTVNLMQLNYNQEPAKPTGGTLYNGVYSGVTYYYFDCTDGTADEGGYTTLQGVLHCLEDMGQSDSVTALFMVPKNMFTIKELGTVEVSAGTVAYPIRVIEPSTGPNIEIWNDEQTDVGIFPVTKPTTLDGYTPKNNKLFTHPYCYMNMSNNGGSNVIYKYEMFNRYNADNQTCSFNIYSAITPGCSIRAIPKNYNGQAFNYDEGINGCKYPVCNWQTDAYTNWMTQNSLNIGLTVASGTAQIVGGVAMAVGSGGLGMAVGGGAIAGGITSILGCVSQIREKSFTPPQTNGNLNSGDVNFSMGMNTFSAYCMTVKKEYAQIIDNFFSMFGYKLNLVKTPYQNHRTNYWYTKTVDVNIDGAIPMDDLRKIKDCYNRGITFWKNPANVGDYSVDNAIV